MRSQFMQSKSEPSGLFSFPGKEGKHGGLHRMLKGPIGRILSLDGCARICARIDGAQDPPAFARAVLDTLNVRVEVTDAQRAMIPPTGPAIVVANHPFGAIEGIILAALLGSVRPDFKIMANFLLGGIPQLRDIFIPVNPFSTKKSVHANLGPVREAIRWVRDGHLLLTFPAGEVAHVKVSRREISDPRWNPGVARIARKTGAPVLPIYFRGSNGPVFQLAGLVHPTLRTVMLPRELLNKRRKTISMKIGNPIPFQRLSRFDNDRDLVDYLRWRTYLLGHTASHGKTTIGVRAGSSKTRILRPIHGPCRPENLAAEITRLPHQQLLSANGDFHVYQATAPQIPEILNEIGRLREICFRAANEGTGKASDLDRFDARYHHIFIWNRANREVVGAYRIGCTDTLLAQWGASGLYTSTLFRSSRKFYDQLGPALELGRSFIRIEHQRSYAPLLLLWKGISRFIVNNPRYRTLFGPVSISRDYCDFSRHLIATTLLRHRCAVELAAMVRPKTPPRKESLRMPGTDPMSAQRFCNDMEEVCAVIADIEVTTKGIPVLLKHYLNLGGQLLSFNVDKRFGNTLDGLICVDLLQSPPKTLQRYFGKEGLAEFYRFHQTAGRDRTGQGNDRLVAAG